MASNLLVTFLGNGPVLEVRSPDDGVLTEVLLHLQDQLLQLVILVALGLLLFSRLNGLLRVAEEVQLLGVCPLLGLAVIVLGLFLISIPRK